MNEESFLKIYGKRKEKSAPPPDSLQKVSDHTSTRINSLEKQLSQTEVQLTNLAKYYSEAKRDGQRQTIKTQIKAALKNKKLCEGQLETLRTSQFNIAQAQFVTEQMRTTTMTMEAIKVAHQRIKKDMEKFNSEEVEKMQNEVEENLLDFQFKTNSIFTNDNILPDYNEEALEAELNSIVGNSHEKFGGSFLPSTTASPSPGSANQRNIETNFRSPNIPSQNSNSLFGNLLPPKTISEDLEFRGSSTFSAWN